MIIALKFNGCFKTCSEFSQSDGPHVALCYQFFSLEASNFFANIKVGFICGP